MPLKRCKRCKEEKFFYSGNQQYCDKCAKERWIEIEKDNKNRCKINSSKRYYKLRDDISYKKIHRIKFKNWYKQNKEKQFKNIKKGYYKHKLKWRERRYAGNNKEKIWKILGNKCKECGKKAKNIHHIIYENLPRGNIKEYCKYLEPLCKKCHKLKNRKINPFVIT